MEEKTEASSEEQASTRSHLLFCGEVDWADQSVLIGNAPPLPSWPAAAVGLAWFIWVVILGVLAF